MAKERMMHLDYDKDADVLYVTIGKPRAAICREVGDDVLLRVDPDTQEVVGLTLLNLSTREVQSIMPIVMQSRASQTVQEISSDTDSDSVTVADNVQDASS